MSQARSVVTPALTPETERELDVLDRVFKRAVEKAREENRRLGIPNVQVEANGQLTEELPDGTIRPIAAEPKTSRS
jgi:hypothetical protein